MIRTIASVITTETTPSTSGSDAATAAPNRASRITSTIGKPIDSAERRSRCVTSWNVA